MKTSSIIFFGTQEFAATILAGFLVYPERSRGVAAVITQPDRPVGRTQIITSPPVKILALKHNIPVFQPESLKDFDIEKTIGIVPDLNVVAQYGLMIPESIIFSPAHKTINVHTSLLPKYRGASPIQSAIMNGDTETGVSIMLMDKEMDTGPILAQEKTVIDPDERYPDLDKKLARVGNALLQKTIPEYLAGSIKPQPQDNSRATVCRKVDRDTGRVDWNRPAAEIYNVYRGLYPWPGIWTTWNNLRVKLLEIKPNDFRLAPGHIKTEANRLFTGTGEGAIEILELQVEGKKAQSAETFLRGYAPNNQNFI